MAGTFKQSAEAVVLEIIGRGTFGFGGSSCENRDGQDQSENVGLSNENIGENPMPRKPKGSSTRFVHGG